jgi:hypothetical protein
MCIEPSDFLAQQGAKVFLSDALCLALGGHHEKCDETIRKDERANSDDTRYGSDHLQA